MIFGDDAFDCFCRHMLSVAPVMSLREWVGGPAIILRHDVDFDIEMARDLAIREAANGLSGVYFFMTSCQTYNVLEAGARRQIAEISDLGFEIGLHFDPTLYPPEDLECCALKEASILEFAAGVKISSISLHNPSIHGIYPLFKGFKNAYDPAIFNDDCYISDSCRSFRDKDPWRFVERARERSIQVLLHPMHYAAGGAGYEMIMAMGFRRFVWRVHHDWSRQNRAYAVEVPGEFPNLSFGSSEG